MNSLKFSALLFAVLFFAQLPASAHPEEQEVIYSDWGLNACGTDMVLKVQVRLYGEPDKDDNKLFGCFKKGSKAKLTRRTGRVCPGFFVLDKQNKNQGICQRF
jgi:hypothetical protein